MESGTHLKTWLASDLRQQFARIAQHEGLSESAMLRRVVELVLHTASGGHSQIAGENATAAKLPLRFTIRLRPGDYLLLKERAAARQMPAARYASIYLRVHLRNLAPLPKDEYQALKKSIAELSHIGRNLNQIARAAHRGEKVGGLREDLRAYLKVCEGLRDHVNGLLAANVKSWKQGYAD